MDFTWYSYEDASNSFPITKQLIFTDVDSNRLENKFCFIYHNSIVIKKDSVDKAPQLMKYLDRYAFGFYYDKYAKDDALSAAASCYFKIRKSIKKKFPKNASRH